jgi:hypothetical protein
LRLPENGARRISGAPTGRWLDSTRIVAAAGKRLTLLNAENGTESVLYDSDSPLESYACAAGKVYAARRETDEDGLYSGSTVLLLDGPR